MSSDFPPRNRQGYDQWSSFYDVYPNSTVAIDDMTFPAYYAHIVSKDILEIGCGTGRHTARLLAQKNRVTGLDQSLGMLERLRSKISDPSLSLIHADFFDPEVLVGQKFDAVVVSLVLEHVRELRRFFERAGSMLRSPGELLISELHPARAAAGTSANFLDPASGQKIQLESFAHAEDEIVSSALRAGLRVDLSIDVVGNDELVERNPEWKKHVSKPLGEDLAAADALSPLVAKFVAALR